jgi:hypothetical protein
MISERSFAHSFESFWRDLFPLLTPHFVAVFNEGYRIPLLDKGGSALSILPISNGVERPDLVAEFSFRLAQLAYERSLDCKKLQRKTALISAAEERAFSLIQRYEGLMPSEPDPLSREERTEGLRICARYDAMYQRFDREGVVEFCPSVRGAGFLDSTEGDLSVGDTLVEVKTATRKVAGKDLRQVLVYLALDANAGSQRWSKVCFFNPRRGTLHLVDVDTLIFQISGGQAPSDVFAELVRFAESYPDPIEQRF